MSLHLCDFCLTDINPTVEELQGKRQELEAESVVPWEEQGVACCCCCLTYTVTNPFREQNLKKKKDVSKTKVMSLKYHVQHWFSFPFTTLQDDTGATKTEITQKKLFYFCHFQF